MAPVDVVKQVYQHLGKGDIDAILEACDTNVEWVVNGPQQFEATGAFHGHDGVREFLQAADKAWMLRYSAPREVIEAGNKVVVLGESAGKARGSGEPFLNRWVHVFTLKEGRIASFRLFVTQWRGDETPPPMRWL